MVDLEINLFFLYDFVVVLELIGYFSLIFLFLCFKMRFLCSFLLFFTFFFLAFDLTFLAELEKYNGFLE